jgi:hypothetical protein
MRVRQTLFNIPSFGIGLFLCALQLALWTYELPLPLHNPHTKSAPAGYFFYIKKRKPVRP